MNYYQSLRLNEMIKAVKQVYPNSKVDKDYVFRNATLEKIATSSAATGRILAWCKDAAAHKKETEDRQIMLFK